MIHYAVLILAALFLGVLLAAVLSASARGARAEQAYWRHVAHMAGDAAAAPGFPRKREQGLGVRGPLWPQPPTVWATPVRSPATPRPSLRSPVRIRGSGAGASDRQRKKPVRWPFAGPSFQ
jgi:hypothetical protein